MLLKTKSNSIHVVVAGKDRAATSVTGTNRLNAVNEDYLTSCCLIPVIIILKKKKKTIGTG